MVHLPEGKRARMNALRVGQHVQTASTVVNYVLAFSHRLDSSIAGFIRISTTLGNLTASPDHLIFKHTGAMLIAADVRVGHVLAHLSGGARVITLSTVYAQGLYNPLTSSGELVVDGFRVSAYTATVPPKSAHSFLVPLRAVAAVARGEALRRRVGDYVGSFLIDGADSVVCGRTVLSVLKAAVDLKSSCLRWRKRLPIRCSRAVGIEDDSTMILD